MPWAFAIWGLTRSGLPPPTSKGNDWKSQRALVVISSHFKVQHTDLSWAALSSTWSFPLLALLWKLFAVTESSVAGIPVRCVNVERNIRPPPLQKKFMKYLTRRKNRTTTMEYRGFEKQLKPVRALTVLLAWMWGNFLLVSHLGYYALYGDFKKG